MPSGKGSRLIILHSGSRKGWVAGAELVFPTGDYYDEMTGEHFEEWFKTHRLLKYKLGIKLATLKVLITLSSSQRAKKGLT